MKYSATLTKLQLYRATYSMIMISKVLSSDAKDLESFEKDYDNASREANIKCVKLSNNMEYIKLLNETLDELYEYDSMEDLDEITIDIEENGNNKYTATIINENGEVKDCISLYAPNYKIAKQRVETMFMFKIPKLLKTQ